MSPHALPGFDPSPEDVEGPGAPLRPLLDLSGLQLEIPPHFEALVGYSGSPGRRYVAFWWACGIDELVIEDGRVSHTAMVTAWLAWSSHPSVSPSLIGVRYGAGDAEAEHLILADRFTRRTYVGRADDVRRFLDSMADLVAERAAWDALSPEEQRRLGEEAWQRAKAQAEKGGGPEKRPAGGIVTAVGLSLMTRWLESRRVRCPRCARSSPAAEFGLAMPTCPSCKGYLRGTALLLRLGELRARGGGPPVEPDHPPPPPGC
jgi:hypothetical protein